MTPGVLRALVAARQSGPAAVLVTRLADGAQWLAPDAALPGAVGEAAESARASGRSEAVEVGGEAWFVQVQAPPPLLVIVGAVHIAQALAPMAGLLGMAAVVVDPRPGFNTEARLPGVRRVLAWPDEALGGLGLGAESAVVALAHDPKLDDPALDAALRAGVGYVGALGSRKSHAARLERLAALGHDAAARARVRGPVGLALGAETAPEIALSILAEIVAVRRGSALGVRG